MEPYADNLEHLLDEFSRIDLLIHSYLKVFQAEFPELMDEFRGLYISEAEIETLQKFPGFVTETNTLLEGGHT